MDFAKNWVLGGGTIAPDLATKGPVFGLSQLVGFWSNLTSALLEIYDGFLSNSLIFALALLSIPLLRYTNRFERLLLFWVATASIPFPFFDSFHQTRLVYDLPIPVLASTSLSALASKAENRPLRIGFLILLFVVLFKANYALRSMFQL